MYKTPEREMSSVEFRAFCVLALGLDPCTPGENVRRIR